MYRGVTAQDPVDQCSAGARQPHNEGGTLTRRVRGHSFDARKTLDDAGDDSLVLQGVVLNAGAFEPIAGAELAPARGVLAQVLVGLREPEMQRRGSGRIGASGGERSLHRCDAIALARLVAQLHKLTQSLGVPR